MFYDMPIQLWSFVVQSLLEPPLVLVAHDHHCGGDGSHLYRYSEAPRID